MGRYFPFVTEQHTHACVVTWACITLVNLRLS